MVFIPKILNVIAAVIVIAILIYRWLPQEEMEKENFKNLIEKSTMELTNSNQKLQKEITEHKQTEKALRKSEYKLLAHLQNTPIGALSWDLNFKAVEWNPTAEIIFGYSRAEALGKHATELILPDGMKELVDGIFQDLLSGKGGNRSTNENITKDGRRVICDWYNTVLKDADGKVMGVASLVNDITESKRAEEELNKYHERLEEMVKKRTAEIEIKNADLEQMNDLFVGREFRIKELRDRIKELENGKN